MPKRRLVLCLLSLSFLRPGWLGLIVLPSFSPAFKRGCNRCVWLFKGQDGWDIHSLWKEGHARARGTSWVAQHQDAPSTVLRGGHCFLPGLSSWRCFFPPQVYTLLSGASPVLLGLWERESRWKKMHFLYQEDEVGTERGFSVDQDP